MTEPRVGQCSYVYRDTPKAREKGKVGVQCGKSRANGTPYCKFHGGNNRSTIEKARRLEFEREIREMEPSFTDMWPEDHYLLDPFSILLWEIRRSGARIQWFDIKLLELSDEKALWWNETKREDIGAGEFAGQNRTYEARENVLVKMQNEERKRLLDLRNAWQNDRFEAARVAGMGAFGAAARAMMVALCEEFEIDLTDEAVQAKITHALEGLPDPLPGLQAAALARKADDKEVDNAKRRH